MNEQWLCSNRDCHKCGRDTVIYRVDEDYEDEEYRCINCGACWWIDGIDS